ncbi:MAG: hypothetical protein ABI862_21380 [Ilumatobacteraceae bacterium]
MGYSQALDWQADALRFIDSSTGEQLCRAQLKTAEGDYARAGLGLPPLDYLKYGKCLVDSLAYGDPYYWSSEMCDLLGKTSADMPDWTFKADVLPSTEGCFYFSRPLALDAWETRDSDLVAISWCRVRPAEGEAISGVLLAFWTQMPMRPSGVPVTMFSWSFNEKMSSLWSIAEGSIPIKNKGRFLGKVRAFATACAFIQQRILVTQRERPERHTRKRVADIWEHEPHVRIVKLRREVSGDQPAGNGRPVAWSCQWVVSGFWRQQYYPSADEHRPIYILPYIKGPVGMPLKAPATKVFEVIR